MIRLVIALLCIISIAFVLVKIMLYVSKNTKLYLEISDDILNEKYWDIETCNIDRDFKITRIFLKREFSYCYEKKEKEENWFGCDNCFLIIQKRKENIGKELAFNLKQVKIEAKRNLKTAKILRLLSSVPLNNITTKDLEKNFYLPMKNIKEECESKEILSSFTNEMKEIIDR